MEMRDTMRDPEFWAYVRAHAADPSDTNITGKFADWLQDREHEAHAILVRNHREPDEHGYTEHPEGQSGRLVFPFSAGRERALHAWQTADPGEGVHVLRTGLHNAPYRQLPVLRWNIPIKDSKWDESQHVTFQAPLTAEQHREFLRHMPAGAIKNQWVRHAHTMGWLEKKEKLARTQPHDSLATAVAESGGEKQKQLADLARQIFKEAGLSPASVRQVYTNEGAKGIRSSLVSIISKRVHPARTRYAAAWYGLLSGEPKLTVFHPHDKGEDTLHIITSPVPNDVMSGYLQRSGLKSYSTEDTPGSGSRAYIYTPAGSELPAGLPEGLHASHTALRGFGYKLGSGSGSDADARANYRDTIRQYEAVSETARVHPPGVTASEPA